MNTINYIRLIK